MYDNYVNQTYFLFNFICFYVWLCQFKNVWFKCRLSPRMRLYGGNNLVIDNTTLDDEGEYSCIVEEADPPLISTAKLLVLGKFPKWFFIYWTLLSIFSMNVFDCKMIGLSHAVVFLNCTTVSQKFYNQAAGSVLQYFKLQVFCWIFLCFSLNWNWHSNYV